MSELYKLREYGMRSYLETEAATSIDWNCPNCDARCARDTALRRIIGWHVSPYTKPVYAVFECQSCFELYRHHIGFIPGEDVEAKFVVRAMRHIRASRERG